MAHTVYEQEFKYSLLQGGFLTSQMNVNYNTAVELLQSSTVTVLRKVVQKRCHTYNNIYLYIE